MIWSISGEHFEKDFTELNPMQKVPVLDDNGFVLTERYLYIRQIQIIMLKDMIFLFSAIISNTQS